jgi:hypothetical protein
MDTFQVTLLDLAGHTITIPSTPRTPLVNLIETFREVVPNSNKKENHPVGTLNTGRKSSIFFHPTPLSRGAD